MYQVFPMPPSIPTPTPGLLQHFQKLQIRRESPNRTAARGAPVKPYTGARYIKVTETHMGALT